MALDAVPAGAARDVVGELDAQGWDALWFGEAYGREAFSAAQLHLASSQRMAVATGIASIYGRDAVAATAAGRLLAELFPGRFVAALGVSQAPLIERCQDPPSRRHWTGAGSLVAKENDVVPDDEPPSTGPAVIVTAGAVRSTRT